MTRLIGVVLILVGVGAPTDYVQKGYLLFESKGPSVTWKSANPEACVTEVIVGEEVHLLIPFSNGNLDKKHISIEGIKATYKPGCSTARLEMRKEVSGEE